MHNVEIYDLKTFQFKKVSLYIQIFLTICLFIALVASIFIKNTDLMILILYGILSLLMLIMAYNNQKFYKRKYMTYIYLIISVILIGSIVVKIV